MCLHVFLSTNLARISGWNWVFDSAIIYILHALYAAYVHMDQIDCDCDCDLSKPVSSRTLHS